MKKLLLAVVIASFMSACGDNSAKTESTTADSTGMSADASSTTPMDSSAMAAPAPMDTSSAMKEDMMAMKDGKMMVMKSGEWQVMEKEMTCTNGCIIKPNGEVTKAGKKKTLTEGMMIDKDGQMMDKDGKMVDNSGW